MTIHNHPEALTQLRADHVEVEYSPLEKIAIELFGVKVNPFKTHMQSRGHTHPKEDWKRSDIYDSGGSPSDVFYDDGEIFILTDEGDVINVVKLHLLHGKNGKLYIFDDEKDEMIEFDPSPAV